ncbi:MAG: hypothetical protein Q9174_006853, partial [Haloplaca sp. 1 TL-2023]
MVTRLGANIVRDNYLATAWKTFGKKKKMMQATLRELANEIFSPSIKNAEASGRVGCFAYYVVLCRRMSQVIADVTYDRFFRKRLFSRKAFLWLILFVENDRGMIYGEMVMPTQWVELKHHVFYQKRDLVLAALLQPMSYQLCAEHDEQFSCLGGLMKPAAQQYNPGQSTVQRMSTGGRGVTRERKKDGRLNPGFGAHGQPSSTNAQGAQEEEASCVYRDPALAVQRILVPQDLASLRLCLRPLMLVEPHQNPGIKEVPDA